MAIISLHKLREITRCKLIKYLNSYMMYKLSIKHEIIWLVWSDKAPWKTVVAVCFRHVFVEFRKTTESEVRDCDYCVFGELFPSCSSVVWICSGRQRMLLTHVRMITVRLKTPTTEPNTTSRAAPI